MKVENQRTTRRVGRARCMSWDSLEQMTESGMPLGSQLGDVFESWIRLPGLFREQYRYSNRFWARMIDLIKRVR